MSPTTDASPSPVRSINVLPVFDPVNCRSLRLIKQELSQMGAGEVLEVVGNEFQEREIRAWVKHFGHEIAGEESGKGQVRLLIRKHGAP